MRLRLDPVERFCQVRTMFGGADRSTLDGRLRAAARPSPLSAFRVADWWQFKLPPPLALFLGTLVAAGKPLMPRWLDMLALLAAIAACAACVSVINDYFDQEEDARSGKANRVAALSPGLVRTMALLPVAAGATIAFVWRGEPLALILYTASWIAFTAYSAPPLRLKTRGLWGVAADASGSTVFPVLLAVTLAGRTGASAFDPSWVAAAAAWAAGWGMRGILWHQALDAASDQQGSVRTFVQRRGSRAALLLGRGVALPLELIGLFFLLTLGGSVAPIIFLGIYFGVVAGRSRLWGIADKRPLYLGEYYDGLLPLAMIAASALRFPADWLLLIPYFILFGRRPARVLYHAVKLSWDLVRWTAYRGHLAVSGVRRRFRTG